MSFETFGSDREVARLNCIGINNYMQVQRMFKGFQQTEESKR